MLDAIRTADREGLRPGNDYLDKLEAIVSEFHRLTASGQQPDPGLLIDFDLLLTDAVLIYAFHLISCRINPELTIRRSERN